MTRSRATLAPTTTIPSAPDVPYLNPEIHRLDRTLARLVEEDLSAWDRDFVGDMIEKVDRWGDATRLSGRQWEQIERMRHQYGTD